MRDGPSLTDVTGHKHSDTIAVKSDLIFGRVPSGGQKVALQVMVTIWDI